VNFENRLIFVMKFGGLNFMDHLVCRQNTSNGKILPRNFHTTRMLCYRSVYIIIFVVTIMVVAMLLQLLLLLLLFITY